jgi:putative membrane protein
MLFEILLALLIGIIVGTFTGITPGIHINLVSAILLSFSASLLLQVPPLALVVFLVSIAITHTFVDFIPSIFLGAPSEDDNALSILPGHEMLIKGKAYEAVVYTLYGSATALFIILIFSPLFYFFLPAVYQHAEKIMPLILVLTSGFLIYFEKTSRPWAILIFSLSGLLGLATLTLPAKEPLLPLFTGLFGISSLITSISVKQKLPPQKISKLSSIKVSQESYFKSLIASVIASPLCSFLPGMGSGQAAVIGSEVVGELNKKEFLILLGSINTIVTGLSFITLYSIGKARTGVAAAIGSLLNLTLKDILVITVAIILVGIISFFITLFLAKVFAKIVSKVNYSYLSVAILIFLVLITFFFTSWLGLLILAVSTALGLLCIYTGIRRTHLMGCLIIPALVLNLL